MLKETKPIRTHCPSCNSLLEVRDRQTLEEGIRCPSCNGRFAILGPANYVGAYQPTEFSEGIHAVAEAERPQEKPHWIVSLASKLTSLKK
ncbi:MAG: hypothetical protein CMJ78_20200 [Planctomycetaceae bacterium]|nr:hypothetical protein [Planctomycetaceae bacterium]